MNPSSLPTVAEAIESAPLWLRESASKGQHCPRCRSVLVKCVAVNPDGMNLNAAYDCTVCHAQWEGY